jgi:hypothetical protein
MYEVNLRLSTNHLRVVSDGEVREVQYNGRTVDKYSTDAVAAPGSSVIAVVEDGRTVVYTVVLVGGPTPRCVVGRNGRLIFSDVPGHEIDRTVRRPAMRPPPCWSPRDAPRRPPRRPP